MSPLKDQIDKSVDRDVENYSYSLEFINNQQNILQYLWCILYTVPHENISADVVAIFRVILLLLLLLLLLQKYRRYKMLLVVSHSLHNK